MDSLKFYQNMTTTEKTYINELYIFNIICDWAYEYSKEPTEKEFISLKRIITNTYMESDDYDISLSKIADFISENYYCENISLNDLKKSKAEDVLKAVENEDIEYLISNIL